MFKIYDNFLQKNIIDNYYDIIKKSLKPYEYKINEDYQIRFNLKSNDVDDVRIKNFIDIINDKILLENKDVSHLKKYNFSLYKENMNYEDHSDTNVVGALNCLIYLINTEWSLSDDGFTYFYVYGDSNTKTLDKHRCLSVLPKIGRAIFFDGRIVHQAGKISSNSTKEKLIINLLYKLK